MKKAEDSEARVLTWIIENEIRDIGRATFPYICQRDRPQKAILYTLKVTQFLPKLFMELI